MSYTCPGCGTVLKKIGDSGAHGKYNKVGCTTEKRFWGKIQKGDGCWLWQGCVNTTGYGMANWTGKKNIVAHRLAYELLRGPIPAGMLALHKCDTPRCCNPDHLFFGTDADNAADCKAKDRNARGERGNRNKLTEADVLSIRREYRRESYKRTNAAELAQRYGVQKGTIINAAERRTWTYLK